jgi:hypothetical protein
MPSSLRSASFSSASTPMIVQYDWRPYRYFGYDPGGASRAIASKKRVGDAENSNGFTDSATIP